MRPVRLALSICIPCVIALLISTSGATGVQGLNGSSSPGGAKFVSLERSKGASLPSLREMAVDMIQRLSGREAAKSKDLSGLRARRAYEKSGMANLTVRDLSGMPAAEAIRRQTEVDVLAAKRAAEPARRKRMTEGSVGYLR